MAEAAPDPVRHRPARDPGVDDRPGHRADPGGLWQFDRGRPATTRLRRGGRPDPLDQPSCARQFRKRPGHYRAVLRRPAPGGLHRRRQAAASSTPVSIRTARWKRQLDSFWWSSGAFKRIIKPYGSYRLIVRGFDPEHPGIGGHAPDRDGGRRLRLRRAAPRGLRDARRQWWTTRSRPEGRMPRKAWPVRALILALSASVFSRRLAKIS